MLRMWLQRSGIDGGETWQGLRSGGTIEMALAGAPLADIMARGYWASPAMAQHYMGFDRSVTGGGPVPPRSSGGASAPLGPTNQLLLDWRRTNELEGFYRAFSTLPVPSSADPGPSS